ncbi:hypothetical protein [Niveispirillum sp. KHB5.9]|uniref:hypothetical protein n=1 Tax=Niveispirillum sp. KHB5.9 TaxID=3400269 RepID=UPI003A88C270
MIFYSKISLILDQASLRSILSNFGTYPLERIAKSGMANITYIKTIPAVQTNDHGPIAYHDFGLIELAGYLKERYTPKQVVINQFTDVLGNTKETKKAAIKFLENLPIKSIDDCVSHPQGVSALSRKDCEDQAYVNEAVRNSIESGFPGIKIPRSWHFLTHATDQGFIVETNYDLKKLSEKIKEIYQHPLDLTSGYLLNLIHTATCDLVMSGHYAAEIATSSSLAAIMKTKMESTVRRREINHGNISLFQDHIIGNAHAIREAVNTKRINIKDALDLVESASRFKGWLNTVHPDAKIIQEYYKEATKSSWAEKLPGKSLRFAICTMAGITSEFFLPAGLGTVSGIAIGAADSFFLDKLAKGWRPSQFIENTMKPLISD